MLLQMLKSKILRAETTDARIDYEGSLAIDEDLMDKVGILPYEKILVGNITNGERFETYVIKGERGSGCICLNGAAARKVQVNDIVIIMSYALMDFEEAKSFKPAVVFPDSNTNKLV